MQKVSIFWFRRDLRFDDNVGLYELQQQASNILPVFIFDSEILDELNSNDPRVQFIHDELSKLNDQLIQSGKSFLILKGRPEDVWKKLIHDYNIERVYCNKDYEPYALDRDHKISELLNEASIEFKQFKDQVIFEENDVLKGDGEPYVVYTPYKNQWLKQFNPDEFQPRDSHKFDTFLTTEISFPDLQDLGFKPSEIQVKPIDFSVIDNYDETRDFPATSGTTNLSPHLRFGTIGIRRLIQEYGNVNNTFLSELIWREFFMQILYHFPKVVNGNFRSKYDGIQWRNNKDEFKKWCEGQTGYPLVDAGMRELNQTGYMHNRVRMVVASFLCKHLLIDWRWGEAYFAEKLLDFELSSNNGNWQWSAGTGCDAAPYFRVFNPSEQLKKFDNDLKYTKKWVPELLSGKYVSPMVDHAMARKRAIETYKVGISE